MNAASTASFSSSSQHDNASVVWYAMSATFGRSEKAESELRADGIECYVPKQWALVTSPRNKNSRTRRLVPVVSNLIFVRTDWPGLLEIKKTMPWLQMMTFPRGGRNVPIIVPDKQMADFMRVTSDADRSADYLSPDEADTAVGKRVKIIGGPFDEVEGTLISSRGRGKKKLVVAIPGLIAVRVEIGSYDFITVCDDK